MRIESLLYATINPLVTGLLRSPIHGIASASLCVFSYRGRRSGKSYTTPLSFMQEGSTVLLLSSHNTRWWNNFLDEPADVEIVIAGTTDNRIITAVLLRHFRQTEAEGQIEAETDITHVRSFLQEDQLADVKLETVVVDIKDS